MRGDKDSMAYSRLSIVIWSVRICTSGLVKRALFVMLFKPTATFVPADENRTRPSETIPVEAPPPPTYTSAV